MLGKRDAPAGI